MTFKALWERLCRFRTDRKGAVALIFALAAVPTIAVVGAAIDYGRALNTKTKIQLALDASALFAASSQFKTDAERIKAANDAFSANMDGSGYSANTTLNVKIVDKAVVTSATVNVPTTFAALLGVDGIDVNGLSEVPLPGGGKAEVVLVLDYSDSMLTNDKYITMRHAAEELIRIVPSDFTNDEVKIGLAPFAAMVYAKLNKKFVVPSAHNRDYDGNTSNNSWLGCTQDRRYPHNLEASKPKNNDDRTKWGEGKPGDWYDLSIYPGACDIYEANNLQVLPLTNNFNKVKNRLADMAPALQTHIALGLEFGWHVISPAAPYKQGVSYRTKDVVKVIVLLTDGVQTSRAWGPSDAHSAGQGEDNLEDMCSDIKDEGVLLFTVAFDLNSADTNARLSSCASNDKYFHVAQQGGLGLNNAFTKIANEIQYSMLRLSK